MQCEHWLMPEHLQSRKERKGEVKQTAKRSIQDKRRQDKNSPSEAFATIRYSAHSVPKATNFFINAWQKKDA
jgi:hypothetical protein